MKCKIVTVFASMLLACGLPSFSARGAEGPSAQKGWLFQQKDFYSGKMETAVTRSSLRINFLDRNCFLVSKAPDWRVVLYNPTSKLAVDMKYSDYIQHTPVWTNFILENHGRAISEPIGTVQYLGKKCLHRGQLRITDNGTVDPHKRHSMSLYVWSDSSLPESACNIYAKLFEEQRAPGLIVFAKANREETVKKVQGMSIASILNTANSKETILETSAVVQKSFPDSYFDYPSKFKACAREADVMSLVNADQKKDLLKMLEK